MTPEQAAILQKYQAGVNPAQAAILAKYQQATPAPERAPDPTEDMSQFERFMAGAGKEVADLGLGIQQMGAEYLGIGDADALRQEEEDRRRRDEALLNTTAGQLGQVAGIVAPMFIPGAGMVRQGRVLSSLGRGTIAGGASAAADPLIEGEDRELRALGGAALGAVGPATIQATKHGYGAAGRVLRKLGVLEDKAELERIAKREARDAQAVTLRQKRLDDKAQQEAAQKAAEGKIASRSGQLSGGQSPTDIAAALRREGIDQYRAAQEKVGQQFSRAEKFNPKLGRVTINVPAADLGEEFAQHSNPIVRRLASSATKDSPILQASGEPFQQAFKPGDVREAVRIVRSQMGKLPTDSPRLPALRKLESDMQASLSQWGSSSPEAAKQLRQMRAADRLFKQTVGKARAEFGVKGTGGKLHEQDFPRVEAILAQLRSPTRAGAAAQRVKKYMPEQEGTLRQMVGALGTDDLKALRGPLAREVLTDAERAEIDALLSALRK